MKARVTAIAALVLALGACGGGGGDGNGSLPNPAVAATSSLGVDDVQRIIGQAVAEAQARHAPATIAVTDRVGNVLAVFQMNGAAGTVTIDSRTRASTKGNGLEKQDVPSVLAAISKAVTGAYLSSGGNAFTTRTASQIIQDHFNPRESQQPGGPLFGVQFSSLPCGDVVVTDMSRTGPRPAPLGLAGDPGGLPLYKNGSAVGGVGIIADPVYTIDLDILDVDTDVDELIAVASARGFEAPADPRAERITVDGRSLRYVDSESALTPTASGGSFDASTSGAGKLVQVDGFYNGKQVLPGVAFGTRASGIRASTDALFAGMNAFVLVDANDVNRYPVRGGTDGLLTSAETGQILKSALDVANRARAQIRRPLGTPAQVSINVVDTRGQILGFVRTPDAPVFGIDVSVQKARAALFFSSPGALAALPEPYNSQVRAFFPAAVASGATAFSNRAIGNLARPTFPDGIDNTPNGPLSLPSGQWSVFNDGLQLDLVLPALAAILGGGPAGAGCAEPRIFNGIQIFPGSVPIYRGTQLVGAIGVSGDGIDQDDMVAFLGLANASKALATGIGNAPPALRADNLVPAGEGTRLRYVNCPIAPFIDSTDQNVCAGL